MTMSGQFGGRQRPSQNSRLLVLFFGSGFFVMLIAVIFLAAFGKSSGDGTVAPVVVKQAEPQTDVRMTEVMVPVSNIDPGTALTPTLFRVEQRPQVSLDDRAVTSFEQIQGFYARSLIVAGQPLHQDYITSQRPNNVEAKIPAGFRAITIKVNATSSVEGWANPGSKVDVIWTTQMRGKPTLITIVENAEVLSVDRRVGEQSDPAAALPSTVTLLVKAQDAQKIQLASTAGSLSLSLRGVDDTLPSPGGPGLTFDDLLGSKPSIDKPQINSNGTLVVEGKKFLIDDNGNMVEFNK